MTRRVRLSTRFAVLHYSLPLAARRLRAVGQTGLVAPNDYNPNNVAPPEKRLLQTSLEADGFTQPVVVISNAHRRIRLSMVFIAMSWPAAKPR